MLRTGCVRTIVMLALGVIYAVMWIGGVAAYIARGGPRPDEAWTAPLFLALASAIVLISSRPAQGARLGAVAAIGFLAEYIGVRCGCVFGRYEYTATLAPSLFGVPVVIAGAWMVVVAYVLELVNGRRWSPIASVIVAAAWITSADLVIDPVAAGPLGYWTWTGTGVYYGVPLRNFAGWFTVSAIIVGLLGQVAWPANPWARHTGFTIVLFFTVLAATFGLLVPAAIGAALCVADLAVSRRTIGSGIVRLKAEATKGF